MFWTLEQDKALRELIESEGLSYHQAALRMGVTRHSAIGRGYRLKLKSKTPPPTPKPKKPLSEPPRASERVSNGLGRNRTYQYWMDIWPVRGGCKYPLGDPGHGEFRFCSEPRKAFSSYCPTHHGITRIPVRPRQAKAF